MKIRCSKVFGAPILRTVNLEAMFVCKLTDPSVGGDAVLDVFEGELEKCRAI